MTKSKNDFDPNELIKASADHEKSLAELQKAVDQLEKRVGDDAKLAISFESAFNDSKKMDQVLTRLVCQLIVSDEDLKTAIKKAVRDIDRKWWNGAWKWALGAIGAVLLVVLGAFLPIWFGK